MLKITTQTVYDWIAAGKLPAIKIGKSYRIEGGDIEALMCSGMMRVVAMMESSSQKNRPLAKISDSDKMGR